LTIYTVQPGDSLYGIASRFGVGSDQIYEANALGGLPYLVVGQALVIPTAETAYTVRPGDSLWSISRQFGTDADAIAKFNGITDPGRLMPGTVLRIPQKSKNYGTIEVNAYIEPSTPEKDAATINEAGEYLTYIAPFSYRASPDGSLSPLNDEAILGSIGKFRIAPLMVVTNFAGGTFSTETADAILENDSVQDTLIKNISDTLKRKGYYGANIDFERVSPRNREKYNAFLRKVAAALHPQNYVVSVALAPKTSDELTGAWYGAHDYKSVGQIADFVVIMTYEWGWSGGPAYAVAPVDLVEDVIKYAVSVIPSRKILMGMPLYGYDWTLPFRRGTFARRISPQDALRIAAENGAQIQFNRQTQSPTFRYTAQDGAEHEVWFEDARSVRAKLLLVNKYDLRGVSYWLLGLSFPQNWLVLNDMYNIVKLVP